VGVYSALGARFDAKTYSIDAAAPSTRRAVE
jgi:hypothetical protein